MACVTLSLSPCLSLSSLQSDILEVTSLSLFLSPMVASPLLHPSILVGSLEPSITFCICNPSIFLCSISSSQLFLLFIYLLSKLFDLAATCAFATLRFPQISEYPSSINLLFPHFIHSTSFCCLLHCLPSLATSYLALPSPCSSSLSSYQASFPL